MRKSAIVVLLLAVVSIVIFKAGILPFLANLRANRSGESKPGKSRSYSAFEPYTFIRIDPMPRRPWVRTDFGRGWVSPDALSNTAVTYSFLPQIYGPDAEDWKREPSLDPELLRIADMDNRSFLVSGNNFAPYPYSLISNNADGPSRPASPGGSGSGPVAGGGPAPDRRSGPAAPNSITPVPEPATAGLLAILCAILAVSGYLRVAKPAAQLE